MKRTPTALFSVARKEARRHHNPRAAELMAGTRTVVVPPDVVVDRLRSTTLVMGVDIETADWVDRRKSTSKGQFGFFFKKNSATPTILTSALFRSVGQWGSMRW